MFERFDEKVIHIGSKDYSMNDLIVNIPERYTEIFRCVRFENMTEFSRALMFARCAEEARDYRRGDLVQQNEVALNWFLKNRPING